MTLAPLWIGTSVTIIPGSGFPGDIAPGGWGYLEGSGVVVVPGATWQFQLFQTGEGPDAQINPLAVQPVFSCLTRPAAGVFLKLNDVGVPGLVEIAAVLSADGVTPALPGNVVAVWFTVQRRQANAFPVP